MTRGMHTKQAAAAAAAGTSKSFKVGDNVKWTSQSAGSWKEKQGTVVEVVPAGKVTTLLREHGMTSFNSRTHESYLVHVPGKTDRSTGTYYWPLVSKLQRVI